MTPSNLSEEEKEQKYDEKRRLSIVLAFGCKVVSTRLWVSAVSAVAAHCCALSRAGARTLSGCRGSMVHVATEQGDAHAWAYGASVATCLAQVVAAGSVVVGGAVDGDYLEPSCESALGSDVVLEVQGYPVEKGA